MKILPSHYARALFESTNGKQAQEVDAIIGRFAEQLRRDGQTGKLPAIITAFSALWNEAHGVVEAEVTSRTQLDGEALATVEQFVMHRYRAKQVIINNRVDAAIRGGIIIRVGDEVIDGSIATQLKKLKKNLTSTTTLHA